MPHIAIITSSYPDAVDGQESAGGFVADFATELSTRCRVTVIAARLCVLSTVFLIGVRRLRDVALTLRGVDVGDCDRMVSVRQRNIDGFVLFL